MVECIYKLYVQRRGRNGNTKAVNFRADEMFYQKTKESTCWWKISVSDVLNAALRKLLTDCGSKRICFKYLQNTQYQVAFEDLKKEILVGHQKLLKESHFCSRCEKGIWSWLVETLSGLFLQIRLSRTCVAFTTIFCEFIAVKLQMAKLICYYALETLELFPESQLWYQASYGEMTNDGKPYRYMPIENYLAFIIWRSIVALPVYSVQSRIGSRFYK